MWGVPEPITGRKLPCESITFTPPRLGSRQLRTPHSTSRMDSCQIGGRYFWGNLLRREAEQWLDILYCASGALRCGRETPARVRRRPQRPAAALPANLPSCADCRDALVRQVGTAERAIPPRAAAARPLRKETPRPRMCLVRGDGVLWPVARYLAGAAHFTALLMIRRTFLSKKTGSVSWPAWK